MVQAALADILSEKYPVLLSEDGGRKGLIKKIQGRRMENGGFRI